MLNNNNVCEKTNYVVDTSALISDPSILSSIANSNIFLPIEVLEEIDNLKTRGDSIGKNARQVNRYLDSLREKGSLLEGVESENGQIIRSYPARSPLVESLRDSADNRIISTALRLKRTIKNVICISDDINFRVKCDAFGLKTKSSDKKKKLEPYSGILELDVTKEIIDALYEDDELIFEDISFHPNQGVLLKSHNSSALCMAVDKHQLRAMRNTKGRKFHVERIYPKSKEQVFAFELLLDQDIPLVTMSGFAGCGKTLLAIAAGMSQLQNNTYKKIVISRPIESTSKDIGYLPGPKSEKLAPWLQPIFDNIEFIYRRDPHYIKMMMDKGLIEVEAISHIRGRSLMDTYFIIDEAQNITAHEAKALLTRVGKRSKIVLIGDLQQIDSSKINSTSSGLNAVIELFKESGLAGHITLKKGERSDLATLAAEIM